MFELMKDLFKGWILICFFICISIASFAQKDKKNVSKHKEKIETQIADKYFESQEYYLAAQEYKKIVAQDPEDKYAIYQLAESYRLHFDYDQAEENYKKAIDTVTNKYPLAPFWYASMLKYNGKYTEAQENFQLFLREEGTDAETATFKEKAMLDLNGCSHALNEMKKPARDYEFHNLKAPVNSGNSDYSPVIYENDSSIALASARKESTGDDEYGRLGGKFSDMYRFKQGKDKWAVHEDKDLFSSLQTEMNESPGSFTHDHKKFYFTKCDEPVTVNNSIEYECGIYVSKFENSKWSTPVKLNENINMAGQWNAQPSISPKGDTLFFVSKRPGGFGMHDIWYSTCHHDDNWGAPLNAGNKVNTPYIDMSPNYYSKEKTLFFASNGHEGFGGLDIFIAKGNKFEQVRNAGLPFNSNRDDFYFVLGEKSGYLSSNREGGLGNDDIYKFRIESKELLIATIDKDSLGDAKSISVVGTMLYDDTKLAAGDVEVLLTDKKGKVLKSTRTNEEGLFRFDNLPPDDYKVIMKDADPRLTAKVEYIINDVDVKKSEQVATRKLFENIYFDFDKFDLRPEAKKTLDDLIAYYKLHKEIQIEMNANTDSYGSDEYNIKLSNNRGKGALGYLIASGVNKSALVVTGRGEDKPLASNENQVGRQLNRRVEFYIIGGPGYEAKAMAYVIEPKITLYSVAKKFNMTMEEVKALNGLEGNNLMAYRPLRVRRTGDNDIIAPATIALGDTHNRKMVEYGGKQKMIKNSGKENQNDVASKNTYSDNIDNNIYTNVSRKGKNMQLEAGEDYYVVEPLNTVYSISKLYGLTPDELRAMNGLRSNKLAIGQRLKVKKGAGLNGAEPNPGQYYVKEGDTMYSIAKRFGMTPDELKEQNHLKSYQLFPNMVLKVKKK
jgi:peptidoglycan-associated lipoprotein